MLLVGALVCLAASTPFGRKQGSVSQLVDDSSVRVQRALVEQTRANILSKYSLGAVEGALTTHPLPKHPECCRLRAACAKLLRGDAITLAVFGSSVSAGADGVGYARAFPTLVAEGIRGWLGQGGTSGVAAHAHDAAIADATHQRVKLLSVAQGGVNTIFPTMMMDSLVQHTIDLALWEYALNDFVVEEKQRFAMLQLFMQRLSEQTDTVSEPKPPPGLACVGMWDYNVWPPRNSSLSSVAQLVATTPSSFLVDFARFLVATGTPDVRVNEGHHPSVAGHRMLADLLLYHLSGVMLETMDGSGGSGGGAACTGDGVVPRATVSKWPFPAAMAGIPSARTMSWMAYKPSYGHSLLSPPCLAARAVGALTTSPCALSKSQGVMLVPMGKRDALRNDRKFRAALPACSSANLLTFFVPATVTHLLLTLRMWLPTSLLVDGQPFAAADLVECAPDTSLCKYLSHTLRLHGTVSRTLQLCDGMLEAAAVPKFRRIRDIVISKPGLGMLDHAVDPKWEFSRWLMRLFRLSDRGKIASSEAEALEAFARNWHNDTGPFTWVVGLYPGS